MTYTVGKIDEDVDFGCEERTAGAAVMAVVTLEDTNGNKSTHRIPDQYLYDNNINENDKVTIDDAGLLHKADLIDRNDTRLRILYLYQMLLSHSDEDNPMTTKQIIDHMKTEHDIYVHRTTVPTDIALLRAAGIDVISERRQSWHYYLADRLLSIPELKLLIDAVQSSKFITEKKSRELIEKISTLTSSVNAAELKRSIHISERVKTDNEKGYYIVDAINRAINVGKKISFRYFEYDANKKVVFRNEGNPYTVSPYDLIWDGDFYYMTGFCDERDEVRTFRVDRIDADPEILEKKIVKRPRSYKVSKYTKEAFRMLDTDEVVEVKIRCHGSVMKAVVDQFGMGVNTRAVEDDCFVATVRVCPSATFYRWIFGWNGKIKIESPDEIRAEYKARLQMALDTFKRYI